MAVRLELTPAQHRRRRMLSRAWAFAVIAWAFLRTILVWAAVGDYGINPWYYLTIDLVCATIDAVTTPRTVLALIDSRHKNALFWGGFSIIAFLVPDVYIFFATDELPGSIIVIIAAVIVATLTFTVVGIRRRVREARATLAAVVPEAVEVGSVKSAGRPPT